MASPEQSERNSTGSSSVSKKVSEIWERMNEGVPNKRFNFVSKTSTSSPPAKKSPNSVRLFSPALFFLSHTIVLDLKSLILSTHRTGKAILVLTRRRGTKLYKRKIAFRLVARRLSALLLPL